VTNPSSSAATRMSFRLFQPEKTKALPEALSTRWASAIQSRVKAAYSPAATSLYRP